MQVSLDIKHCVCTIQSVQFHERGEGHKAQVARRLTELTRKGEVEYRQQQQINTDLQKMEEAAMRAYHKDVTSNPDLSARVSYTCSNILFNMLLAYVISYF